MAVELLEDPAGRLAAARIDEGIAGKVGVDRPGKPREALEVPDAVGQLLHQCAAPVPPRGSPLCSARSSSRAIWVSPSRRTGSPSGSPSISRLIRFRTWSAK